MKRREDMLTTLVDQEDLIDPEAAEKAKAAAENKPAAGPAAPTNNRRNRRVRVSKTLCSSVSPRCAQFGLLQVRWFMITFVLSRKLFMSLSIDENCFRLHF